jgi:hypothetical protein
VYFHFYFQKQTLSQENFKTVIKEYGRWSGLEPYINYIETYIKIDFSLSLENAKSLLETVGKEICTRNSVERFPPMVCHVRLSQFHFSVRPSLAQWLLKPMKSD